MTKAEWSACADPQTMLEFLCGRTSDRKLRLFAVACCRTLLHLLCDERSKAAICVAECCADHGVSAEDLSNAFARAHSAYTESDDTTVAGFATQVAAHILEEDAWSAAARACEAAAHVRAYAMEWPAASPIAGGARSDFLRIETEGQTAILRCVFNPFCPIIVDRVRKNGVVVDLAQAIYTDRAFDRLPILADALEDAGCTDSDVLAHCRCPGPHVRGCWVVDSLLERA